MNFPPPPDLRRDLHRLAEPSGEERRTAARVADLLASTRPDLLVRGLGGTGVAALWRGRAPGPRLLVRAELDALPIPEEPGAPGTSETPGVSHRCGHDGHMALVLGLAPWLAADRTFAGEVVLLFQPAEETGEGARRVLDDRAFAAFRPDLAVALHNVPGFTMGEVLLRAGAFASASRGLAATLTGATAHAAEPERGRSPALAVAALVQAWSALPQVEVPYGETAKVTVVHARVGERAFGTSPGEGVVMATLRGPEDDLVDHLETRARTLAKGIAAAFGLRASLETMEPFPVTRNDPGLVQVAEEAAADAGLAVRHLPRPFPWSEDFGHFGAEVPSLLLGLGAGEDHPPLHHPTYVFPDGLLAPGGRLFQGLIRRLLT